MMKGIPLEIIDRARQVSRCLLGNEIIEPLPIYSTYVDHIAKHHDLLMCFLQVEDWETCPEEKVDEIAQLLSLL
jgi:hypothetical protein